MERHELSDDRIRNPVFTVVVCIFILFFGFLFSCLGAAEGVYSRRADARTAPGSFPVSTPEEQGMDSELLAEAIDYLLEERDLYNIHSLTIVCHGRLVADVYFYPYQPGYMHNLASTTKVFMTTLIGIAIDKGYIASVGERVIDFFPDRTIANLDDRKRAITIGHLLTMTSGLGFDDDTDTDEMQESSDWVQVALDLPMSQEPGTWWNYHQPTAFLLSAILTEVTGMSALEFAREHLFGPLGIVDAHWTASPRGMNSGYNELKLSPHDLAKFGQLILQQGQWDGEQVVSREWVDTATSTLWEDYYGYMWNHYPEFPECFQGGGALGQRLVVSPSRDLVVVFTGGGYAHEDIERIYLEALDSFIFPAVLTDVQLPPHPEGVTLLDAAISRAATHGRGEPRPVEPPPVIAEAISSTTYTMDENAAGVQAMGLIFPSDDEARLRILSDGAVTFDIDFEWVAGLDGVERCARAMLGIPACGTGAWLDDRIFEMTVDSLGLFVVLRLTFRFEDGIDRMTVTVEDLDWWDPDPPFTMTASAIAVDGSRPEPNNR